MKTKTAKTQGPAENLPVVTFDTRRSAITTRYHADTEKLGARMSARAYGNRIFIPYGYLSGGIQAEHAAACAALVEKMGWNTKPGRWCGGGDHAQDCVWVHVLDNPNG